VVTVADGANRPAYNSTWQIRSDAWCSLEETSGQLVLAGAQHRPFGDMDEAITKLLDVLGPIERFWAFPGTPAFQKLRRLFTAGKYDRFAALVRGINRALATDSYRNGHAWDLGAEDDALDHAAHPLEHGRTDRPYFEVLVVEDMTEHQEHALREELRRWRRPDDPFIYEIVVVPSLEDAIMAARLNFRLQACVVRRRFARRSRYDSSSLAQFIDSIVADDVMEQSPDDRAQILARALARLRPELDLYLMTEIAVEDLAGRLSHHFRRIFHAREGSLELHLSILDGVAARYRTPFFNALKNYSHRPTGVFHALPISHGKSITESHWISDMIDFYGLEIFLAETSATCGGLDSLLEPTGPLREAQQLAAKTFGSRQTYFVTNGTSTANKIVVQALVQPGDIVLVDRNCHQSHHYGLMLAGAMVTYLDAYPLNRYSMYGAVPLKEIKSQLLALRRAGKLDRVKMVLLTNCTFDGIVYDVARVMEECLAIKPDLIFLWDEAWFAFARFHPVYRPRTAMRAARTLAEKLRLPEYRAGYQKFLTEVGAIDAADDDVLLNRRLMPDPARARVRVYSTQSTHKTLNTVLFMTTIGTTRSSVAYLIEVLVTIARDLENQLADMSPTERAAHERAVQRLTSPSAPLPDFSGFHPSFTDDPGQATPEGDVRRAFYLAYNDTYCEYLKPEEVEQRVENGEQVVSTTYVTPYPPGYPVLVPGQVFSQQILSFMRALDTPEIHGYRADLGYRVYVDKALEIAAPGANSRPEAAPGSKAKRRTEAPRSTSE
jgi:arginine decarboxylase